MSEGTVDNIEVYKEYILSKFFSKEALKKH
jgi:hypothetical protein